MNPVDKIINNYEKMAEETGVWHDFVHMKLKALIDFHEGRELTDRQKEIVEGILYQKKRDLEDDLSEIEDNNDLNMEIANRLQQSIDEVNREMERLE